MNTKPYRIYKGLAGGALVVLLVLAVVLTPQPHSGGRQTRLCGCTV